MTRRGDIVLAASMAILAASGSTAMAGTKAVVPDAFSCGKWLEAERSDDIARGVASSWIWGYLARATNAYNGELLSGSVDGPSIRAWMDNYCRTQPLSNIWAGARELERRLAGQNGVASPGGIAR